MNEQIDYEVEPADQASTALVNVVAEGDPELMLAVLEKKAEVAPRMAAAMERILVSQTYVEDWTIQGDGDKAKACLGSAGAERIARLFPISYRDVAWKKEEFTDKHGKAYRFVYTGYATLYDRTVYVNGTYSTRDAFLGKAHGEWRPIEEINENSIRSASYHVFCGNAIKALLGLRGMPKRKYDELMGSLGQDAKKSGTVRHGTGTQGGTSADDHAQQAELAQHCIEIAESSLTVDTGDDGKFKLVPVSDSEDRTPIEIAKDICIRLSSFTDKEGKKVNGKGAKDLKGKWLGATLGKARSLAEQLEKKDGMPW